MHGVYSRLNTSRDAAASGDSRVAMLPPNSTSSVATTLSLAMKPLRSAVQMRQSPRPSGANSGTSTPATMASILSAESDTMFRCRSKLWRNHTTTVAMRMTEKARCKKSLAFSHRSCATFLMLGRR